MITTPLNRKITFILLLALSLALQVSYAQSQKRKQKADMITYFQSGDADSAQINAAGQPVFRLQPGTEISITVSSPNPQADLVFNPLLASRRQGDELGQVPGYVLDHEGVINFPTLGLLNLRDMTTTEVSGMIQEKLKQHLINPFVNVRVLNFQVSVMGEVTKPGVLNIHRSRLTLTEALSMAGDLTIYGKRKNVLVIREEKGKREFGRIDLNDRSIFRSPYYYLRPNDVVYVEPIKNKKLMASQFLPWLPSIISTVSLISIVAINLLQR